MVIVDDSSDIEQNYIDKEINTIVVSKVKDLLTDEQFRILTQFLNGDSYSAIAETNNISNKQVDNMLQAIKKKLKTLADDAR